MKRYADPQKTIVFVAIAAVLMVVVDLFVFGGWEYFKPRPPVEVITASHIDPDYAPAPDEEIQSSETVGNRFMSGRLEIDLPQPEPVPNIIQPEKEPPAVQAHVHTPPAKDTVEPAAPAPLPDPPAYPVDGARIAIIIDDMGMDRKRSYRVLDLPAPITVAFLPYAPKLPEITAEAKAQGHELMIHMPMQPLSGSVNSGPLTLREDMDRDDIALTMKQALQSFEGYEGLNNHMGSRITQNEDSMGWVMEILAELDLYFVDSKTIQSSVAADAAARNGLRHASRDVFLDHEDTPAFVTRALRRLENVAARKGHAIAIGHPKDVTIKALQEWLPTLEEKGFKLVPASALVRRPVSAGAEPLHAERFLDAPVQGPPPPPE